MTPDARHCHPDQATLGGNMHNDNYSISNSGKVWAIRNNLWSSKYNMAVWQNGDHEGLFHKGSNATEFLHRNVTCSFDYLKMEPVYLDRIPVLIAMMKCVHNIKRARLITITRREQAMEYDADLFHIHDHILKKLEKLLGLDLLRRQFRDGKTVHHYLYFENTDKKVQEFLYGFKWKTSVVRITSLSRSDKELIWRYILEYEDKLRDSNGKIWNTEALKWLQMRLKYKVGMKTLKTLIFKYWIIDEDLFDAAIAELEIQGK